MRVSMPVYLCLCLCLGVFVLGSKVKVGELSVSCGKRLSAKHHPITSKMPLSVYVGDVVLWCSEGAPYHI